MQKIWNWLALLNWTLLVAGFMGGTLYVVRTGSALPWYGKIGAIVTGVATSYYCAEWIAVRIGTILGAILSPAGTVPVPVEIPLGPAGFVCGLCAQTIVSGLIDYAEKKKGEYINPTKQ